MKLFDVYPLFDVNIVKGKGCHVWDDKGQEYLDLYGGHAVISIGHTHPHYVEAISKQGANINQVKNDVLPFVRNPKELDIWSNDYFVQLADMIKIINV